MVPMQYRAAGKQRQESHIQSGERHIQVLDNTPVSPPFTSPFNYVIIFKIHKLSNYSAAFSEVENSRIFCLSGGGIIGTYEVLQ